MKRNTTKFMFSLGLSLMILFTFASSVRAYYGSWTSNTAYAIYGASQVGTTYAGGAGDAVMVVLTIKLSSGDTVGTKTVGATIDQRVEHIAWGAPFTNRYGIVSIRGYHLPWFHANA